MRKGYIEKVKIESQLLRFQTALICEAFLGKGQGTRFVMESWHLEDRVELQSEDVKELLKGKMERETMLRLKEEKRKNKMEGN